MLGIEPHIWSKAVAPLRMGAIVSDKWARGFGFPFSLAAVAVLKRCPRAERDDKNWSVPHRLWFLRLTMLQGQVTDIRNATAAFIPVDLDESSFVEQRDYRVALSAQGRSRQAGPLTR